MVKRSLKKSVIGLVLCLILTAEFASTASAATSGNISFGGATITWDTTSTQFYALLKNNSVATLYGILSMHVDGFVGERLTVAFPRKELNRYEFIQPTYGYTYVKDDSNHFTYYINDIAITSFNPYF